MTHLPRLAGGLALAAALLAAGDAPASQKIATSTGRTCTSCHDKPGSRLLTDTGKYYEAMRTLDGYDEVKEAFGRCTTCHERKPGSMRLTRKGRQLAELVHDMSGLGQWVRENHPAAPAK